MASQLYVWDFTLSVDKTTSEEADIIKELNSFCKAWVFQKEDSGIKVDYGDGSDYGSEDGTDDGCEDDEGSDSSFYYASDSEESVDENAPGAWYFDNEEEPVDEWSGSDWGDSSDCSDCSDDSEYNPEKSGYVHWQGKISLRVKKRKTELLKLLNENNLHMSKAYFSPSSNNNLGSLWYCMKLDTRIAGRS